MLDYARNDTHWLIYLYERLKEDLITLAQNDNDNDYLKYVRTVLLNSNELCKFTYKNIKPPTIWESLKRATKYDIVKDLNSDKNKEIITIYHVLELFKDRKARELDINRNQLMSQNIIALLSKLQPNNYEELKSNINNLPDFVEKYHNQIIDIIKNAKLNLEKTIQKLLDLPESNNRYKKYKEIKNIFDNPINNNIEIDIFKNLHKSDKLKNLENEFDLDNVNKINYKECYDLNGIYDEIMSQYEISFDSKKLNQNTKLESLINNEILDNSVKKEER